MLRQFDCARLPNGTLAVVLQDDVASSLLGRVVAPLVSETDIGPATRGLNPTILIEDRRYRLKTELLGAVPLRQLSGPVANVAHHRDDIVRALDLLFTGV
jgi:toxin CcdB